VRSVDVRAYFDLATYLPPAGRATLPYSPGLTVSALAIAVGVPPERVGFVLANGRRAELGGPVGPGDRVALFPDYLPYHRV
jgi:hypothetical protein